MDNQNIINFPGTKKAKPLGRCEDDTAESLLHELLDIWYLKDDREQAARIDRLISHTAIFLSESQIGSK